MVARRGCRTGRCVTSLRGRRPRLGVVAGALACRWVLAEHRRRRQPQPKQSNQPYRRTMSAPSHRPAAGAVCHSAPRAKTLTASGCSENEPGDALQAGDRRRRAIEHRRRAQPGRGGFRQNGLADPTARWRRSRRGGRSPVQLLADGRRNLGTAPSIRMMSYGAPAGHPAASGPETRLTDGASSASTVRAIALSGAQSSRAVTRAPQAASSAAP